MADQVQAVAEPAAEQVLFERVYAPEFVKACAARGLVIASVEDFAQAYRIVGHVKNAEAAIVEKQAAQTGNLLKTAADALEARLQGPAAPQADLSGLLQDPAIVAALTSAQA